MLTLQIIEDVHKLETLAPEWDKLHAGITPRLPFSTHAWVREWWHHYRRDSIWARDELKLLAVRTSQGELLAIAPMFLTHRPGRGNVTATELQFIGADGNVTEIRGVLCRPEDAQEVVLAISAHLKSSSYWNWVQWRGLRLPEGVDTLPSCVEADQALDIVDYVLDLTGSWDSFKSTLPRNIKEAIRKCYNSLKREGISFKLRIVHEPSAVEDALQVFFRLHTNRADARNTIAHKDVFSTPADRNFLQRYCLSAAQKGQLRIFQLIIDGKVVATRVGFLFGDELYLYYSGYDPEWGRFSVMTTAVTEILQWAFKHGLQSVNLSTGSDTSKMRWRPTPIVFRGGVEVANNWHSKALIAILSKIRARRKQSQLVAQTRVGET